MAGMNKRLIFDLDQDSSDWEDVIPIPHRWREFETRRRRALERRDGDQEPGRKHLKRHSTRAQHR
jgi:hypothetical protein